jgi:signal transduction histidine kinase
MRERVALYGGRFQADRGPSGGFAIRVLLPIP